MSFVQLALKLLVFSDGFVMCSGRPEVKQDDTTNWHVVPDEIAEQLDYYGTETLAILLSRAVTLACVIHALVFDLNDIGRVVDHSGYVTQPHSQQSLSLFLELVCPLDIVPAGYLVLLVDLAAEDSNPHH